MAIIQTRRLKKISYFNKSRLELLLADANYISFEPELMGEIAEKLHDQELVRLLNSSHQRARDMYIHLVEYYIDSVDRFTFEDARRICQPPIANYQWQERHWRSRARLRTENSDVIEPEDKFLRDRGVSRYEYYADRKKNMKERQAT